MDRREFLRTTLKTGAVIGSGVAFVGPFALGGCSDISEAAPKLDTDLLNDIQNKLGPLVGRFAENKPSTTDFLTLQTQITRLANEFSAKGAADSFRAKSKTPGLASNPQFTAEHLGELLFERAAQFSTALTPEQFARTVGRGQIFDSTVDQATHVQRVQAGLAHIVESGLTSDLINLAALIGQKATPTSSVRPRAADGGTVLDPLLCAELAFYIGWLGLAATELAILCIVPGPQMLGVCPAAGIIGIIAGILAAIQFWLC